ncbi:hypothetical protein [Natrinema salaciae]|uniref:Uncharacterized protein n=1 Tax=Natrinema salaciae TaxID=1186196 RepID=A0A1H9MLK0_9EURY|nr:hypothetical protein [Natrinema salaciae]SER24033.1 hypothetical protein SAMN04489841_3392 [Natrinema salaciae]
MDDGRTWHPSRLLLAVLLAIVPIGVLAAWFLEVPGDRVTIGAVVIGAVLVIGALVLPALLLSSWQSDRGSR